MIDAEMTRKAYAKMPDAELIAFTQKEGLALTQKAFIILKQETRKRGLPLITISEIEAKRIEESIDKIHSNLYKWRLKEYKDLYSAVLKQKHEDIADEEIVSFIVEKGYNESEAIQILNSIAAVSKNQIEEAGSLKIVGVISMVIGAIALYHFTDVEPENLLIRFYISIVPYTAIVGGLLRFLTAVSQTNFHKRILNNTTVSEYFTLEENLEGSMESINEDK